MFATVPAGANFNWVKYASFNFSFNGFYLCLVVGVPECCDLIIIVCWMSVSFAIVGWLLFYGAVRSVNLLVRCVATVFFILGSIRCSTLVPFNTTIGNFSVVLFGLFYGPVYARAIWGTTVCLPCSFNFFKGGVCLFDCLVSTVPRRVRFE